MLNLVSEAGLNDSIIVDSAGTTAFHAGERADPRSRAAAAKHAVDLPSRARQFRPEDFERFDYVVAMDTSNKENLERMARSLEHRQKIRLLCEFDKLSQPDSSVPDPYYGGADGFENVFQLCLRGCQGLLAYVQQKNN